MGPQELKNMLLQIQRKKGKAALSHIESQYANGIISFDAYLNSLAKEYVQDVKGLGPILGRVPGAGVYDVGA